MRGYYMAKVESNEKESLAIPDTISFTTEQRVDFLAQVIVDRILEDMANGSPLLHDLEVLSP